MAKVNAISSTDNSVKQTKENLSNDVLKQLKDLGIDSSNVKSDAEGKRLIKEALKKKEIEKAENVSVNYISSDNENLILRDAKLLAKKLGMEIRPDLSLDDLLTRIFKTIKKQKAEAKDDKMKEIQNQKNSVVYITLKTRQNTLLLKENGLVNSMDANSLSNKKFLNL